MSDTAPKKRRGRPPKATSEQEAGPSKDAKKGKMEPEKLPEKTESADEAPARKGPGRRMAASKNKAQPPKVAEPLEEVKENGKATTEEPVTDKMENGDVPVPVVAKAKGRKTAASKGKAVPANTKENVTLHVKDLKGEYITLEVNSSDTVGQIKSKLEKELLKEGLQTPMNFTFRGDCEDNLPISHYNKQNCDDIMLKMRGDMTVFINDVPVEAYAGDTLSDLKERFIEVSNFDEKESKYCRFYRDGEQLGEFTDTLADLEVKPFTRLAFETED